MKTENPEYGFYAEAAQFRPVMAVADQAFEAVARALIGKLSISEKEAVYLLDSSFGRHFGGQLKDYDTIEEISARALSLIDERGWRREAKRQLEFARREWSEEMQESTASVVLALLDPVNKV